MIVRAKALIAMTCEEKNIKVLVTSKNLRKVGLFPSTVADVPDVDGTEPVKAIDSPEPIHIEEVPSSLVLAGQEGDVVGASVHSLLASDDFDEATFELESPSEGSDMFGFVHIQQRSTPTETSSFVRATKRARVELEPLTEVPPETSLAPLAPSLVVEVEPSLPMSIPPSITDAGTSSSALAPLSEPY
ncbi:uncharacterized protein LOC133823108 [Humulus lupulus]|uniref:uncharacterized protein LOC133823108 n=1 Tax=Humulus lupulus TaxID=3486 RepID=UPI002B40F974|nr:uncharacterized protein LOC133823108 [Humulus lupulus]